MNNAPLWSGYYFLLMQKHIDAKCTKLIQRGPENKIKDDLAIAFHDNISLIIISICSHKIEWEGPEGP